MALRHRVMSYSAFGFATLIVIFTVFQLNKFIRYQDANTYTCFFQSSTEVFCYDHDGSLFKLFKRVPDKFTVVIPPKMEKP